MKKISEIGLEIIQLEDQVLLVHDHGDIEIGDWFFVLNSTIDQCLSSSEKEDLSIGNDVLKVVASTKPLEGIPLLVIEDEVDEIAEYHFRESLYRTDLKKEAFIEGYNKAKEKFKFTEQDLRKALWELGDVLFNNNQNGIKEGEPELYFDTIIQSLTKKELWIEVEEWSLAENVEAKNQNIPKITNNQIKAVWK